MSTQELRRRAAVEARRRLAAAVRVPARSLRRELNDRSGELADSAQSILDRADTVVLGSGLKCQSCGYELAGLPAGTGRCPECAALLTPAQREGIRIAAGLGSDHPKLRDPGRFGASNLLTDSPRLVEEIERERRRKLD